MVKRAKPLSSGMIRICFKPAHWLVKKIRWMEGAVFKRAKGRWYVKDTQKNRAVLAAMKIKVRGEKKTLISLLPFTPATPPAWESKLPLRDYQKQGVDFLFSRRGRALLADEMGLGKTPMGIVYAEAQGDFPVVVVCPATLKRNWQDEIRKFTNTSRQEALIISGTPPAGSTKTYLSPAKYIIINYDILGKWVARLRTMRPRTVLIDEAQYIKNDTKRTKAVRALCKGVPHVVCLSGTPIENRPIEIFNVANLLNPQQFADQWKFIFSFSDAKMTPFGLDTRRPKNLPEFHKLMTSTIMIRRKKADVLKELPAKTRVLVALPLKSRKRYDKVEEDFTRWIQEHKSRLTKKSMQETALSKIEALRQEAFHAKIDAACAWIDDYLDAHGKLVVFIHHQKAAELLEERYKKKSVSIRGGMSQAARKRAQDEFMSDKGPPLLIGNLRAAGVGLTLTAAAATATLEIDWVPSVHLQAEDRVHRFGQKADAVLAYYLLAEDTIETTMFAKVAKKMTYIQQALDGEGGEEALDVHRRISIKSLVKQYAK